MKRSKSLKQYSIFFTILLLILANLNSLTSQVLIFDTTGIPDSTAMLEVRSTIKGFLPPRMTEVQRNEIINPTAGLIIYCSDCLELQLFNDTAWTNMIGLPPSIPPNPTVIIVTQTWTAANLNLGTMINGNVSMTNNSILEKHCYDNDPNNCTTYGGLYQWDEMMQYVTTAGTQGICPAGFHLPTDDEWKTLEIHLGMTQSQADQTFWRGTDQGSQLAGNEPLWIDGDLDQDANFATSGFGALPGGVRSPNGPFSLLSSDGWYWSSSESGILALDRDLSDFTTKVHRGTLNKDSGLSVRCIQD